MSERRLRPDFSLVVSTIGRPAALERLLGSLARQTHPDAEIIIVDQSEAGAMRPLVEAFAGRLEIVYLRSALGLSHGRNIGLSVAAGRYLAFPDDDCWYPPDTLARVRSFFRETPHIDILTGCAADDSEAPLGRRARRSGRLTRSNVWTRAISISIFLRREVIAQTGGFDENLGAGSRTPIGSGEETDLLIRALDLRFIGHYDCTLVIRHAVPQRQTIPPTKAHGYGVGMGFVIARHRLGVANLVPALVRPLGGCLLALARGDVALARYYLHSLRGRCAGYWMGQVPPQLGPCPRGSGIPIW